jgi:hypothetical protein
MPCSSRQLSRLPGHPDHRRADLGERPDKVPIAGREERLDLIGATIAKNIAKRRDM